jgi:hypothetical protein
MADIVPEDVTDWLGHPVTKEFMNRVKDIYNNNDKSVHKCLKNPHAIQEAALYNAAMDALEEVLDGPQTMIEDLKGISNESRTVDAR